MSTRHRVDEFQQDSNSNYAPGFVKAVEFPRAAPCQIHRMPLRLYEYDYCKATLNHGRDDALQAYLKSSCVDGKGDCRLKCCKVANYADTVNLMSEGRSFQYARSAPPRVACVFIVAMFPGDVTPRGRKNLRWESYVIVLRLLWSLSSCPVDVALEEKRWLAVGRY